MKLEVDAKIELKKAPDYKVIGKSIPRVDIPAKVTGEFTYVHDVRVPGMLHARVIRPDELGARIASVDDSAARQVSGFVQTVRKGDFLAVVARNEWAAIKAARAVRVTWTAGTGLPEQATVFETWRKLPVAKEDVTQNVGDAKAALDTSARRVKATYDFAVQTHATIGPSCAVADFQDGKLTVWTSSQATHSMQHELSSITGLPREAIRLVFIEGAGCYGRNGTEDAAADASLISTIIGQPVRVQWSRADETARSPKSPPRTMDWRRASTRRATWSHGRATSTSRSTTSWRSSRSTSRCSRRARPASRSPATGSASCSRTRGSPTSFPTCA